jgi:hypothetical protein
MTIMPLFPRGWEGCRQKGKSEDLPGWNIVCLGKQVGAVMVLWISRDISKPFKYGLGLFFAQSPRFSQAICYETGKHCAYCVTLEKYSRHTASMPASIFRRAPCTHSTYQFLATIFVRKAGKPFIF